MFGLKKNAVIAFSFFVNTVYAGAMGASCRSDSVTVPCASSAWVFSYEQLYLQPLFGIFNVPGFVRTSDSTVGSRRLLDFTRQWNWGFKFEAGYHFYHDNDVTANWYNMGTAHEFQFERARIFDAIGTGRAKVSLGWSQVNLEFGHTINLSEYKRIRFYGGGEYVGIQGSRSIAQTLRLPGETTFVPNSSYEQSIYDGYGARTGVMLEYGWDFGLSTYVEGGTGLLVGIKNYEHRPLVYINPKFFKFAYRDVVPEFEAKLGIKYKYPLAQGQIVFDAGWLWYSYLDAFLYHNVYSIAPPQVESRVTNFSIQGTFFGFKWIGNID